MQGEIQTRQFYVPADFPGHATITALRAGTNLDLAALQPDGTAVANDSELVLALKNNKGGITLSDVIKPGNVLYAHSKKTAARVGKTATISAITAIANQLYTVSIPISGYGSLSIENEYIKEGFYKSKTGDTAENIVDGLVQSLARNFSREQPSLGTQTTYTLANASTVKIQDNAVFTFSKTGTGASAALVITEKNWLPTYYVTGKKTRTQLDFRVEVRFPGDTLPTIVQTVGVEGTGTGYQVRNMEYYLLGNRQDSFRGAGYPHNFEAVYDSDVTKSYHLLEIGYYDESRDDPMKSKKQITVAIEALADMNLLIAEVNKSLNSTGITVATLV